MTKTFENYPALTSELAFDLIDALKANGLDVQYGSSNQSCSTYAKITVWDDDGDYAGEFKVRFSDHADRHGSDITIRIDHLVETVENDGEYISTTIEDWRYDHALEQAKSAVDAFIAAGEFED